MIGGNREKLTMILRGFLDHGLFPVDIHLGFSCLPLTVKVGAGKLLHLGDCWLVFCFSVEENMPLYSIELHNCAARKVSMIPDPCR